ncbi:cell division protein FtsQ/DivIB [Thermodesulfovibrio hydrogeniphilus]
MSRRKITILMVLIVAGVVVFLLFHLLKIRHFVIIGNKHLKEHEIKYALSIKEGSSLLYPSSKTLYERLKKMPWIKDAVIRKDLNGTLTIYIQEASPVAVAKYDGSAYLIDRDGRILEDFTDKLESSLILLPILKNIDPINNRETLQSALELLNFLNSKGFISSQDNIIITGSQPENLTLFVNDFPIIVGKGELELKFAKYAIVLDEIKKRGIKAQYVDLRVPDRVIVKPVE